MKPRTPRCKSSTRLILAMCVASALLITPTLSFADPSHQPAITEARAEGAMLRIFGLNLGGAAPRVTLGGAALSIVSATATQVEALIPAGVAPGSYLLTLALGKTNDDGSKYDEFWVTIGAAGPQGPIGEQGPRGPVGPQGPAAKDGAVGPAGPTGPAGPAGPVGAAGVAGAQGPAGNNGLPGTQGPAGNNGLPGPQGPAGTPGALSGWQIVSTPFTIAGQGETGAAANCPPGKKVVGGGFIGGRANNVQDPVVMLLSSTAFTSIFDGWVITVSNKAAASFSGVVQAICVTG